MTSSGMTFSHSRLETYESCPLKFKFQYIDKVEVPKRDSVEAFLGSRVHDALEALYRGVLMGKIWSKEEFLKSYADVWAKEQHDDIFIVNKQYTIDDYFRQGQKALSDYWERYHPFDAEQTIALEERVTLSLDDADTFKIQGFIDRISKTKDGVWQIRDYKTKRRLATQQDADQDRQLALYQIGLRRRFPQAEKIELIWHYLLFDEEVKSVRERSDLEKLKIETIHLIQEVEESIKTDRFPYRESALCDWCDFFDICPAKRHLAQVRLLEPQVFKKDDGVQLADRFTEAYSRKSELQRQIREIEAELDSIKEEIYRYAQQFMMTKIYGSSRHVNVTIKPTVRLPASDDKDEKPVRRQLEEYLKNTKLWEEVSQLTPARLVKLYETGELADRVKTELSRFLFPTVEKRVRIGSAKDYDENFEM